MLELKYSPLVKNKMKVLKEWLIEHYDDKTTNKILSGIISDVNNLRDNPEIGTDIAKLYDVDTEYWYIFSHQHYLVYRFSKKDVTIIQMFHEREDFMMKLFGISGRTQESIDYWGY